MARGSISKVVNKNGTTTYYIQYRNPAGKKRKIAIGPKKKEAEAELDRIMAQIRAGTYTETRDITFAELCDKWLGLKETQVRPNTFSSYEPALLRLRQYPVEKGKKGKTITTLAKYPLKAITPEICEAVVAYINKSGVSPATASKAVMVFNNLFNKAVEWGYISRNPAQFVKKPKIPQRDMNFLSLDEINKVYIHVKDQYKCLVLTVMLTGMRLSEVVALSWNDIDFEKGIISVRKMVNQRKFYDTKNLKIKRIVVPQILLDELSIHKMLQEIVEVNPNGLVFPGTGGLPLDGRNLSRRVLHPAIKKAGLGRIERPFHALRHSYASILINQGENVKFIQSQLGHSSARVTLDRYSHVFKQNAKEAAERLNKNFGTIRELSNKKEGDESSANPL